MSMYSQGMMQTAKLGQVTVKQASAPKLMYHLLAGSGQNRMPNCLALKESSHILNYLIANFHKMINYTQAIRRQFVDKLFECVWSFCEIGA